MNRWIAPFAAAAIALAPAAFAQTAKPDADKGDMKITAETFVQKALASGEKEVSLSELAATKATKPEVKQLAQMLADDHKQVNEQLRLISKEATGPDRRLTAPGTGPKRTETPPSVNPGAAPSASDEMKQLTAMQGAEFDKAYLNLIVDGHENSVELYESAAQSLPAGAAKKLAENTLPKIKQHLQQAKSLQGETMPKTDTMPKK